MKSAPEDESLLAEINVTPLVDVMLVLLIIFMVTAPLIQQGIAVNLPESEAAAPLPKEERDIILYITKDRKLTIDRYQTTLATLGPKLKEIFKARAQRKVYIRADRQVPYGYVVEVMGKIKAAGIEHVGMVTDLPKELRAKTDEALAPQGKKRAS